MLEPCGVPDHLHKFASRDGKAIDRPRFRNPDAGTRKTIPENFNFVRNAVSLQSNVRLGFFCLFPTAGRLDIKIARFKNVHRLVRTACRYCVKNRRHVEIRVGKMQFGGNGVSNTLNLKVSNRTLVVGDMIRVNAEGRVFFDTVCRTSEESEGAVCLSSTEYKSMVCSSLPRIEQKTINTLSVAVDFYTSGPEQGRGQPWVIGQNPYETYITACTLAAKDCTVRNSNESFSERKAWIIEWVNALGFSGETVLGEITTKELGFPHFNCDDGQSSKNV